MELRIEMTCPSCPEQYDVYLGDRQVAYFRLRHGTFSVDMPECGGETVFQTSDFDGDGRFEDDAERQVIMARACEIVKARLGGDADAR